MAQPSKPLVLVALEAKTVSFSIKPQHAERLKHALPDLDFAFYSNAEDFLPRLPEARFVITWQFRPEWYAMSPNLKAVLTPAAGHDWAQPDPFGKVPGLYGRFHGYAMSEYLLAMMLYHNLNLGAIKENQRTKNWERDAHQGRLLKNQKVLIFGYGNIGRICAERLHGFGCRIFGVKRSVPEEGKDEWAERILKFSEVSAILPSADHVVAILPSGPSTDGIITQEHFAAMRGVFFYNMGRGNCYQEKDLVWALKEGHIQSAALDVFVPEPLPPASPLWSMSNVFVTPHISAVTGEYLDLFLDEMIPRLRNICQ